MPAPAQMNAAPIAPSKSTGPRTPEGKAKSSRNATRLGLFSTHDFILPEDRPAYAELAESFNQEFAPEGPVEETLTLEIIRASWRLQRCAKAEAAWADRIVEKALEGHYAVADADEQTLEVSFTRVPYAPQEPLQDETGQRFQAGIDRARAHANNTFRRALADLRRIQAQRHAGQPGKAEQPAQAERPTQAGQPIQNELPAEAAGSPAPETAAPRTTAPLTDSARATEFRPITKQTGHHAPAGVPCTADPSAPVLIHKAAAA